MTYLFVFCRFFINCKEYYLFTALIVTSLPNIASKTSLYLETDWDTLFDRKKIYKLTTLYKIHNNCVQKYLSQIVPNTRGDDSTYRTKN